jgi:hypothetical protein
VVASGIEFIINDTKHIILDRRLRKEVPTLPTHFWHDSEKKSGLTRAASQRRRREEGMTRYFIPSGIVLENETAVDAFFYFASFRPNK